MADIDKFLCAEQASIREVMARIDANASGIAMVVDGDGRLRATFTDGDLRRAILAGHELDDRAMDLTAQRAERYTRPITAPVGTAADALLALMRTHSIRHVPLVDGDGRVADVALQSSLLRDGDLPVSAVVMAGGRGTRLRPLTEDVPKPMLPVGDQPLLERIVRRLRQAGIRQVVLTTHYKPEQIVDHFGDGSRFGVELDYIQEGEPLGTAGALSKLDDAAQPLLVMNGDILTEVDFRAFLDFHRSHDAALTVAVRKYDLQVPYGVVRTDDVWITDIEEKPRLRHFINAGIYLLEPDVWAMIPADEPYDMPQLIRQLTRDGRKVACFPVLEYWLDIGAVEDYQRAQRDVADGTVKDA